MKLYAYGELALWRTDWDQRFGPPEGPQQDTVERVLAEALALLRRPLSQCLLCRITMVPHERKRKGAGQVNKHEVRGWIEEIGTIPAGRVREVALFAAEAIGRGGIPIVEITLTVSRDEGHFAAQEGNSQHGGRCSRSYGRVSARQSLDAGHRWCRGARNRQRIDPRSAEPRRTNCRV